MNFEKIVKKELIYSKIFILIGIAAGIAAMVTDYQRGLMIGMALGFLPTGIGTMLVYKKSGRKADLRKNIELEHEERNVFINNKAGHTAFWIAYWYVFSAVILSFFVKLSLQQFLIFTLFFMPVAYFTTVFIYHKRF
ncbi:MAG: hypothetical protein AB9844_06995 [Clostridiaceae bacterium]